MRRSRISWCAGLVMPVLLLAGGGCATVATVHPREAADIGSASRGSALEVSLARPGVATFQRVAFARWTAGRGAFIDRDDPRTAVVPKGDEEATIYAYVIDHPRYGRYLIDGGVSLALEPRLNPLMRRALHDLNVRIDRSTAEWLAGQAPPRAVFLTHLHFDHVGGVLDLADGTPVYVGAGDAEERNLMHRLTGRPADIALSGKGALREWTFTPDPDGVFAGVIDVFGDGSVWAISLPGHSPGSTGYLINAVDGPKLVTGDAVSTRLGWEQGMPQPLPASARAAAETSAAALHRFVAAYPAVEVFLGHQSRAGQTE